MSDQRCRQVVMNSAESFLPISTSNCRDEQVVARLIEGVANKLGNKSMKAEPTVHMPVTTFITVKLPCFVLNMCDQAVEEVGINRLESVLQIYRRGLFMDQFAYGHEDQLRIVPATALTAKAKLNLLKSELNKSYLHEDMRRLSNFPNTVFNFRYGQNLLKNPIVTLIAFGLKKQVPTLQSEVFKLNAQIPLTAANSDEVPRPETVNIVSTLSKSLPLSMPSQTLGMFGNGVLMSTPTLPNNSMRSLAGLGLPTGSVGFVLYDTRGHGMDPERNRDFENNRTPRVANTPSTAILTTLRTGLGIILIFGYPVYRFYKRIKTRLTQLFALSVGVGAAAGAVAGAAVAGAAATDRDRRGRNQEKVGGDGVGARRRPGRIVVAVYNRVAIFSTPNFHANLRMFMRIVYACFK